MAESWVFGANDAELGRGLNHLPYTAFLDEESGERRLGVGIGACVLDLARAADLMPQVARVALNECHLNSLMELGPPVWNEVRKTLQALLHRDNKNRRVLEAALLPERILTFALPIRVSEYTDFYASRHHARRVGELFRPQQPLLDNYDWVPIGYHGRASSVIASGTEIKRPSGQLRGEQMPRFSPTERLDYEAELGLWIGVGNARGEPVPVSDAGGHLFGVSLLNDWSARDIQAWEYQPLGPFLGKNFATSVSPWVTPMAALEGVRGPALPHIVGLLDYLRDDQDQARGVLGVQVRVSLSTARSRKAGFDPFRLSEADASDLYWTPAQMVAHHASGGCSLRVGDLLGTGTVSGADRSQGGCLLELTRGGVEGLRLPNGEERRYLEDGDEVELSAWARPAGEMPIRLGLCTGRVAA